MKTLLKRKRWLLEYTLMFGCVMAAVLALLFVNGKGMVIKQDGQLQYAPALMYLGDYIRNGLRGSWPMVDFSLGQGLDVLTTLAYYCFAEPLALLAAVFEPRQIDGIYNLLIFSHLYLSGLFACMLARYIGSKDYAPAAGVIYAFCAFALDGAMRHIMFGVGVMFLPLMLLGVERVFAERKWKLYVLTAALGLVSNFYYAYMNTVVVCLYILVRLSGCLAKREPVGRCAATGGMLLGGYLLGAALSAVVLIPVAAAFFDCTRLAGETLRLSELLKYEYSFYARLFVRAFQPSADIGHTMHWGFIPLCAFGLFAVFARRFRAQRPVCIMLLLCGLMLCMPVAGKVMNGMGYVSNRWAYALSLFVALGVAAGLEALAGREMKRMLPWLCAALLAYAAVCAKVRGTKGAWMAVALFGVTSLALLGCSVYGPRLRGWARGVILALTVCSVGAYSLVTLVEAPGKTINEYRSRGEVGDLSRNEMSVFEGSQDEPFHRVSGAFNTMDIYAGFFDAYAALLDYNGTGYYWSIIPSAVSDHYTEIYGNTQVVSYALRGLGGDAVSNLLASVKYMYVPEESRDAIAPGFEIASEQENGTIRENAYALPLGYTYDTWMSDAAYDALPAMEKRDALLRTAVVDAEALALESDQGLTAVRPLEFAYSGEAGVLGNGETLRCEVPEVGEVFLMVEGVRQKGDYASFEAHGPGGGNRAQVSASEGPLVFEQQGVILSMGEMQPGEAEFTLDVPTEDFRYDEMQVYFRSNADYFAEAEAREEDVLENVRIDTNRVSGTISLNEAKWLQLSVPYSKGWTAEVDGKAAELSRSGGMYMGLLLEPGEHEIVLSYCTPWLKEGAAITAAAVLAFAACALWKKRRQGA